MSRLPPNDYLTIERNAHILGQLTLEQGLAEISDAFWLPGEKAKARSTQEIVQVRWMAPAAILGPELNFAAAASLDALLVGIDPDPKRRILNRIDDLRLALRESRDIEQSIRVEALRTLSRLESLLW